jgi:predicted ribosome quality control (RQC) complex YloA/Tae2 family protein
MEPMKTFQSQDTTDLENDAIKELPPLDLIPPASYTPLEETKFVEDLAMMTTFDMMLHDVWTSESCFNNVRKEIEFMNREMNRLDREVLRLTRRLEEVEDERDKYKKCCGEL